MYRPENWEEIKEQLEGKEFSIYSAYETGADTILEGLRKRGIHFNKGDVFGAMPEFKQDGTLVFIPDE